MQGMNRNNGKFISDKEHLTQSIQTILNTPIGSRVMLPEFGSEVVDLIDAPMTQANILRIYAATISAVQRWEPRIEVEQVQIDDISAGKIELSLTGFYNEKPITIQSSVG